MLHKNIYPYLVTIYFSINFPESKLTFMICFHCRDWDGLISTSSLLAASTAVSVSLIFCHSIYSQCPGT